MVFGNALDEVTASGWGLDDLVFAKVRAAAGGSGVRRITYAKDAFKIYAQAPGLAFQNARTQLNDIVQQVTAGANCERYVLVTPTSSRFGNTNQGVTGIGVVHWDSILSRAYVFSLTYIRVFDGQTFDVIKQDAASIDGHSALYQAVLGDIIRGPFRQFDSTSFPATPPDVLNNTAIRDDARALLTTSLDRTLPDLLQR